MEILVTNAEGHPAEPASARKFLRYCGRKYGDVEQIVHALKGEPLTLFAFGRVFNLRSVDSLTSPRTSQ